MDVNASPGAVDFIRERGGKLFVWSKSSRCCRGRLTFLEASTDEHGDRRSFKRVPAEGIDLYVALPRLPDLLEINMRGYLRRRVRAYWNGCAWVT